MKNVGLTGLDGRGKALTLWAAGTVATLGITEGARWPS